MDYKSYFLFAGLTMLGVCSSVLAVNFLVDPLWYYDGNRISDKNFIYNERYSKAIRFSRSKQHYDCLVFGSSTATLLNERKIEGYRCYNFAVSGGNLRDASHLLQFAKAHIKPLRLVVVGLDPANLLDAELDADVTDFIRDEANLPNPVRAYLALDLSFFSLQAMVGMVPPLHYLRYYKADFTAELWPGAGRYRPELILTPEVEGRFGHSMTAPFGTRNVVFISQLRAALPGTKLIGYGPPIFANYIGFLYLSGSLEGFLKTNYQAAKMFDAYYDFTRPSAITADAGNTPDGEHFNAMVNDAIVHAIQGKDAEFGTNLHKVSLDRYVREYVAAAKQYVQDSGMRLGMDIGRGRWAATEARH
jgi:hypothetical protein